VDVGDRRDHDAAHLQHLGDDVATHHSGANEPDPDGLACLGTGLQIGREAAGNETVQGNLRE
jgi:hypothetical protein